MRDSAGGRSGFSIKVLCLPSVRWCKGQQTCSSSPGLGGLGRATLPHLQKTHDRGQSKPPSPGLIAVHGRTAVTALLGPASGRRMEGLSRPMGRGGVQGSGLPSRVALTPWGLQCSPQTGTQWLIPSKTIRATQVSASFNPDLYRSEADTSILSLSEPCISTGFEHGWASLPHKIPLFSLPREWVMGTD